MALDVEKNNSQCRLKQEETNLVLRRLPTVKPETFVDEEFRQDISR